MYLKMQQNLVEKHEAEKEGKLYPQTSVCSRGNTACPPPCLPACPGALEAQRMKYEEQLAKLKEQLESNTTSPTPPTPKYKITTYVQSFPFQVVM